ncbi:pyrimidine 5'-nucleotidase [Bartonella sp. HY406]|uniref:pyrimidine 5'-nucleotidase n=1 Tax=Bartonella sp. HY406 TaxID=2979331 RepID=UPI0021C65577|nr:pyrimidine 5'-nucleotidase [Bartonella sp. HY406]UXN02793.1 pyrimidine 5'-nucleotidase [Bartonella sp. HY406]
MGAQNFPTEKIDYWVFDLDNTLYPPGDHLFSQVDIKMTDYVSNLLNMDRTSARQLQKDLYRDYGTTLSGLMHLHDIDPEDFLNKVHDIDYSWLSPAPILRQNLQRLTGKKYIFTNGDHNHAISVLTRLGIENVFDGIFDIKAARYIPKPKQEAYDIFIKKFAIDPSRAVMFEDLVRNLKVPKSLQMQTVLIEPILQAAQTHDTPQGDDSDQSHIDFKTNDLGAFLEKILI